MHRPLTLNDQPAGGSPSAVHEEVIEYGIPFCQREMKTLGVNPRRSMEQIVEYRCVPGHGYSQPHITLKSSTLFKPELTPAA